MRGDNMIRATLLGVLFVLSGQVSAEAETTAVVDANSDDAAAVFKTISAALESAPRAAAGPYRILIRKGVYREKLVITRPDVHLLGEDRHGVVISWDDTGSTLGPDGRELGTAGSATLTISAPGFRAENLTVENSFDYAANLALPENDPGKVRRMQAVALMTTGDSDKSIFESVTIRGFQDTLFANTGRHWFHNCRVEGHVDFIFVAGQAVFDRCEIVSRNRKNKNPTGYVTAPSTHIAHPYGMLFINSRFLKDSPEVPAASVRLGRPWHPNGSPLAEGSAVFINCFMDNHIGPEGYAPISAVGPDGVRKWFKVDDRSRFFEQGSYGPGAIVSKQRPQLSPEVAEWYTAEQVLNGWNPASER